VVGLKLTLSGLKSYSRRKLLDFEVWKDLQVELQQRILADRTAQK